MTKLLFTNGRNPMSSTVVFSTKTITGLTCVATGLFQLEEDSHANHGDADKRVGDEEQDLSAKFLNDQCGQARPSNLALQM